MLNIYGMINWERRSRLHHQGRDWKNQSSRKGVGGGMGEGGRGVILKTIITYLFRKKKYTL